MATLAPSPRLTTITLASPSAGPFLIGFRLFDVGGLVVTLNGSPPIGGYTVNAAFDQGYDDQATIELFNEAPAGAVIVIEGSMTPARDSDYLNGDPGLTRKLNIELPRIWAVLQEVVRGYRFSLRTTTAQAPFRVIPGRALFVNEDGQVTGDGPSVDEIRNAQGYAEEAKAAAAFAKDMFIFPTRAAFVAWAAHKTPSVGAVAFIGVYGQQDLLTFGFDGVSSAFLEPELAGWFAAGPVWLEHYGVVTRPGKGQDGPDYTAEVQACFDATEGDILFSGFVNITDKVVQQNRSRLRCPKGHTEGGFTIRTDFNMDATCVLQPGTSETAGVVDGITIWFQQPPAAAARAALIQYPPAVNIGAPEGEDAVIGDPEYYAGLARGRINLIRIEGAWDGIIGVGNCGGYRLGQIEVCAFNRHVYIDGALDFVHAESIHCWPFGIAGNAALAAIYYDGVAEALRLGKVDNWSCDKLSTFRTKVVLEGGTSRLPFQFGSIGLDGSDALLELRGGSSQIGNLYSTKAANAPGGERDILTTGGVHRIGNLQMTSSADGAVLVDGPGANLQIGGGDVFHLNNNRRAFIAQNGGHLDVSDVAMRWDYSTPRAAAFMEQVGTGSLRAQGCHAPDVASPPTGLIKFNTDHKNNALICPDLGPHTAIYQRTWVLGYYGVGTPTIAPENDANKCVIPGLHYTFGPAATNTPVGQPQSAVMEVFVANTGRIIQDFLMPPGDSRWLRFSDDGGANWSPWTTQGGGAVSDPTRVESYGSGNAAIASMAAAVGYVRFTSAFTLTANATIAVPVHFAPGASVGGALTLTINNVINSPVQQVFRNGLTVVLGHSLTSGSGENARQYHVSWFGAFPSAISPATSCEAALQRGFDAVGNAREARAKHDMGNYWMRGGCLVPRGVKFETEDRRRTVWLLDGDGWDAFTTIGPAVRIEGGNIEQPTGSTPRNSAFFVANHEDCEIRNLRGGYSRKNIVVNAPGCSVIDTFAVYSSYMGPGSSFVEVNSAGEFFTLDGCDLRSSANGPEAIVRVNCSQGTLFGFSADRIKTRTDTIPVLFNASGGGAIQGFYIAANVWDGGISAPAIVRIVTSGSGQVRVGTIANTVAGGGVECGLEIIQGSTGSVRDIILNGVTLGGTGYVIKTATTAGSISRIIVMGLNATSRMRVSGPAAGITFIDDTASVLMPPGPFANDAAAATGGVAVGQIYRTAGGTTVWRQA